MKKKLSDLCDIDHDADGQCEECFIPDWKRRMVGLRLMGITSRPGIEEVLIFGTWCDLSVTLCSRCVKKKPVVLRWVKQLIEWRRTLPFRVGNYQLR